jgi:hypothetical protein
VNRIVVSPSLVRQPRGLLKLYSKSSYYHDLHTHRNLFNSALAHGKLFVSSTTHQSVAKILLVRASFMIIIWGTRLAGTCDNVPNLFYVRTQFGHIWYIPLIPIKSYVILSGTESGGNFRGTQIPMSGRSVLYGWARTFGVIGGIVGLIGMMINGMEWMRRAENETLGVGLIFLAVFAASILSWVVCATFSKASRDRAFELAEHLGIAPDTAQQLIDGALDGQPPDVEPVDDDYPR